MEQFRVSISSRQAGCARSNGGRDDFAGYPVIDLRVKVCDGSYHDVDSSELAFKIAGSMALKDGAKKAGGVLLEPIMDVGSGDP